MTWVLVLAGPVVFSAWMVWRNLKDGREVSPGEWKLAVFFAVATVAWVLVAVLVLLPALGDAVCREVVCR
jgi:hypothetical protein